MASKQGDGTGTSPYVGNVMEFGELKDLERSAVGDRRGLILFSGLAGGVLRG